jgi:hypothetical protein
MYPANHRKPALVDRIPPPVVSAAVVVFYILWALSGLWLSLVLFGVLPS